ncbi:MAG TPA: enoyl-CoA hydratase/isomerase family protein [Steroidobacteraceae bacterium]|nr:enoyl-CoA hydratase/isomerase family protein [Steroidobacteraceae bacterium]
MHTFQSLRYELEGSIARITLNRPDSLNAIDYQLHEELLHAFLQVRGEREARAVLFASTGKAFSAGGDLNEIARLQSDASRRAHMCDGGLRLVHALIDVPIPIVVALQGDALGLGASVALGCDIIVAAKTARIGDPHVKVGLVAGDGGCLFWPAAVGMNRAKRYLLTGDLLGAEEAWRMGLVTDLVEKAEEALPAAQQLAQRVAQLPPIAVRGTKQSLNSLLKARAREGFDLSMAYEYQSGGSEDTLEAVAAFKERRKPVYRNR